MISRRNFSFSASASPMVTTRITSGFSTSSRSKLNPARTPRMPEAMFPAPSIFSMVPVFDSSPSSLNPWVAAKTIAAEGGGRAETSRQTAATSSVIRFPSGCAATVVPFKRQKRSSRPEKSV